MYFNRMIYWLCDLSPWCVCHYVFLAMSMCHIWVARLVSGSSLAVLFFINFGTFGTNVFLDLRGSCGLAALIFWSAVALGTLLLCRMGCGCSDMRGLVSFSTGLPCFAPFLLDVWTTRPFFFLLFRADTRLYVPVPLSSDGLVGIAYEPVCSAHFPAASCLRAAAVSCLQVCLFFHYLYSLSQKSALYAAGRRMSPISTSSSSDAWRAGKHFCITSGLTLLSSSKALATSS